MCIQMDMVIQVLIISILAAISYWWYNLKRLEQKLKWIPQVPGVPILGNALDLGNSTDILKVMMRYTKEYEGLCVMSVGPRKMLLASDVKFLEFVLTTTKILDKSAEYEYLGRWLGNGLLTAKGLQWKKSRKIITPAFHFTILEQFVPVFNSNSDIMVANLEKEIGNDSVDIFPYVTMCSLDIICETAMGVSINAQVNPQSDYVSAVKEMCRITIDRSFSALKRTDFFYRFFKDYYKELGYVKTLHAHTTSVINSRKKELQNNGNNEMSDEVQHLGVKRKMAFLDLLLQVNMDGKPLPDNMIRQEVDTFMFEGHDTTASAITFLLYCLVDHPDIQANVFEEQRQIFGEDRHRSATYRDLQEMKCLELAIKESLRLYPSVPFYARETDQDILYKDGLTLPKGINIMIFSYGANRNPKVFADPERFDPTRFENMTGISPFSYIPFSAGPRNCIGQKFAMLEMKAVVSKLLRNYELLQTTPQHRVILAAETVLKSVNGVRVKLRKRNWDIL